MRIMFSGDADAAAVESDILDDFAAWVEARRSAVADDFDL